MRQQQSFTEVAGIAREHYTNLAYHNFLHALNVTFRALSLARRLSAYGYQPLDLTVVKWAGLMHDAGFRMPLGYFSSREEMSACLAVTEAVMAGRNDEECRRIHEAIMATNPSVYPLTTEAKILRAADLGNLAQSYRRYSGLRDLLCQEDGRGWDIDCFWKQITGLVEYLWPLLDLTPRCFNPDGVSEWHRGALGNLFGSLYELAPQKASLVFDCDMTDPLFRQEKHDPFTLLVGLTDDEGARRELTLEMMASRHSGSAIQVFLPGDNDRLPLPRELMPFARIR